MKGFIFTTDAVMALTLVLIITFTVLILQLESLVPERNYEKSNFLASDIMNVLIHTNVGDVTDKPSVNAQITSGNITSQDFNRTVLDLIGSYWGFGNHTLAGNISKEVLEPFTADNCIALFLEEEGIYSSCQQNNTDIALSTSLESGYEIGKPVAGYIARAFATKIKKNNTLIIKGDIINGSVKKPTGGNNNNAV